MYDRYQEILNEIKEKEHSLYKAIFMPQLGGEDIRFNNIYNLNISDEELRNYLLFMDKNIKNNKLGTSDLFINFFYYLSNEFILFSPLDDFNFDILVNVFIKNNIMTFEVYKYEILKYLKTNDNSDKMVDDFSKFINNVVLCDEIDLEEDIIKLKIIDN